jgi:hypothetical protein
MLIGGQVGEYDSEEGELWGSEGTASEDSWETQSSAHDASPRTPDAPPPAPAPAPAPAPLDPPLAAAAVAATAASENLLLPTLIPLMGSVQHVFHHVVIDSAFIITT